MVMKHNDFLKENISNSNFAVSNNLTPSNLSMKYNNVSDSGIYSLENNFSTPQTAGYISPYLNGTKFQILSQISEKKVLQKKSTDITSSFAQACKIYRANSDEFRCNKKKNKKDKISTLNKFHEPTIPQAVSDMNDSEYLKRVDNNRKYKQKKRRVTKKPSRPNETKTYEFYNGDLLRTPRTKAGSDNSNKNKGKNCKTLKTKKKRNGGENIQCSDVWSMLKDMNTFQYISSPPISVGSIETIKKKGKRRRKEKEPGFIETCTTEEFSYISSYDIASNSQTLISQQSSFDRITIIDRIGDFKAKRTLDLNPRTLKKNVCQTKNQIRSKNNERQNLSKLPNHFEICCTKKRVNNKGGTDLKKKISQESLSDSLNRYDSQATVLNNYDKCADNLTSKDKFIKITPKTQSTFAQCNDISEAIKCNQSNDKLLEASEKSSKAGFSLSSTKLSSEINNKGKEVLSNIREPNKNPRASIFAPKLTKTEIRRRLANLKFPIIILGKDEISSKFHVVHYDFEQFNGLSQQIWLYMTEWIEDLDFTKNKNKLDIRLSNSKNECVILTEDRDIQSNSDEIKNSKFINKANVEPNTNYIKTQKTKVLDQFKNKMMGLLSNKNQKHSAYEKNFIKDNLNRVSMNRKNGHTTPQENPIERNKHFDATKIQNTNRYPWSKVKWASDFIDNILRKMKKGIYYIQNNEDIKSKLDRVISIPVQTDHVFEDVGEEIPTKITENAIIPGFDDTPHNMAPMIVEVKMMTRTQISIYHCSTNVVLQFDVTIPSKVNTIPSLSLSSFTPVEHEDKTTLYKCKTSLANAALPAQLCSIIPKLISRINETHKNLFQNIQKIPKNENPVPSICCETKLKLPQVVEKLTQGNFSITTPMEKICERNYERLINWNSYSYNMNMKLLPSIQINISWAPMFKSINFLIPKSDGTVCTDQFILGNSVQNNCMALVPYVPPYISNILPFSNFKFKLHNILQKYLSGYINFVAGISFSGELSNCADYNNINNMVRSSPTPDSITEFPLNVSISSLPYNSISDIETRNTTEPKKVTNEKKVCQRVRKNIRKTFKCHTKCKSMTNMVKESCSTPINKIENLDGFIEALGCCKQLSAVLQGYSEKKILSSINEMKTWIKEIVPTQALLVLLLSNKKETKNLKRFRPVLLQGIAVKRITTATELDMEIEVIEKENICISQNEGISLLSTSNGYKLLDELYWIAKTTASDYQKPFDDSSKKLLKSLLEKRKKLNPSYLRVMARYVGLGLLKPKKYYT